MNQFFSQKENWTDQIPFLIEGHGYQGDQRNIEKQLLQTYGEGNNGRTPFNFKQIDFRDNKCFNLTEYILCKYQLLGAPPKKDLQLIEQTDFGTYAHYKRIITNNLSSFV